MNKVAFVVGNDYQGNRIFDLNDKHLNRDNCLYPYYLLKTELANAGIELSTQDIISPNDADIVIYIEMPRPFPKDIVPEKSYLMLFETELIRPDNWVFAKHRFFKKIFTWDDRIVDGNKYIKFNFPNELKLTSPGLKDRRGLLTSISGNKTSSHSLELYSKRKESIQWFSKYHPDEFKYYGIGWDYPFSTRVQKGLQKLHLLNFFPKNRSPSYGGRVNEKLSVLKNFKFALCYENGRDIDGYITEKIFDCFFACTIPVYWGAGNIANYVPANCFIDRTRFKNDSELYTYLSSINDTEVLNMQKNVEEFLKSEKMYPFTNENFVKTISETILNE